MLKILEVLRKGWDDDLMGVTRSGGDWKGRWLPSLVEIRHAGDTWYVSPDQIMRVAVSPPKR